MSIPKPAQQPPNWLHHPQTSSSIPKPVLPSPKHLTAAPRPAWAAAWPGCPPTPAALWPGSPAPHIAAPACDPKPPRLAPKKCFGRVPKNSLASPKTSPIWAPKKQLSKHQNWLSWAPNLASWPQNPALSNPKTGLAEPQNQFSWALKLAQLNPKTGSAKPQNQLC